MAVLRAMRSGNRSASRGVPASPNRPSPEGSEPETSVLKPFERMCPRALPGLHSHHFVAPRGKKKIPRANEDKIVDVCSFFCACGRN